ncbi:hypothetical protein ACU5DF_06380 [Aliivibrio wodanis]|uniref:hypothetical protein n=1 Tax=Aliivibrio wodanis TaxID=80852 RepID=UPI00406C3C5A
MDFILGGNKCSMLSEQLNCKKNKIIASIYSDDKLSEYINLDFIQTNKIIEIHILGDLINIPKSQWIVRNHLLFLLHGLDIIIHWYDGDLIEYNSIAKSIAIDCKDNYKLKEYFPTLVCNIPELKQITYILGFTPKYTLDNNGYIFSIDFSKSSIYSESYLSQYSEKDKSIILSILSNIDTLKEINLSFSNITSLPVFRNVQKLDLRGNENIDLSNIFKFKNIKHLNISACKIRELPESLINLKELSTLLAYKNNISSINFRNFPTSIKRLSLYRNTIKSITLSDRFNSNLLEINLGANPLFHLNTINLNSLEIIIIIRKVYSRTIEHYINKKSNPINIITENYNGIVNKII